MRPLDGIRVIDFGHYIAGPMAASLLINHGVKVCRVQRPYTESDATRDGAPWNHGKEIVTLDLKSPEGHAAAMRLIADADVLIENFRPGVMDRLGLGPHSMRALNARLIYCSMPGFAESDPRSDVRAWEGVVAAAVGLYGVLSTPLDPKYTTIPLASTYAAVLAASTVVACLIKRRHTNAGERIEVPLFDAMLSGL